MQPFVNTAIKAATKAGRIITNAIDQLKDIEVGTKAKNNFVTPVDIASEQAIIETLLEAYPDHCILGEEGGLQSNQDSDYQWIIDPLDGTTNFIHGYPHFCVSIALTVKGRVEHAVVYDPLLDDVYSASHGRGAQKNNRRIRVNKATQLSQAMIGTVLPASQIHLREYFFDAAKNVFPQCRSLRIAGAAALDLAYVSAGQLDGFWSIGLKPWDIAAASLIIKEAGGVVTDFKGGDDYLTSGNIIACNPKILRQLIEQLKPLQAKL